METDVALLSALRSLEPSAGTAQVRLHDGDAYTVRVISTMYAEFGDEIVAEVLESDSASAGAIPAGSFMNFLLADVVEVKVGGVSVFALAQTAAPGVATDGGA